MRKRKLKPILYRWSKLIFRTEEERRPFGKVWINGKNPSPIDVSVKKVAYNFQSLHLFPHLGWIAARAPNR